MRKLFTSESVTEGHPDKMCDLISDAILDAILEKDPNARVACETATSADMIHIMGQITASCSLYDLDLFNVARETVRDIGYDNEDYGFNCDKCRMQMTVDNQSADIALGTNDEVGGAGDQGMMFGYACDETAELMPLPISLSHKLAKKLTDMRKTGVLDYLRPDGKTQVTVEYTEDGIPARVDTIVVSTQHSPDVSSEQLLNDIMRCVILPVIPERLLDENTKFYINPTGRFVVGGPEADTGLTGRKIIVDTYGGYAPHGGGAFSGKDPTKVDRSAAYAARWIAKNIVATGLASCCQVQLAYAIGVAQPVSVRIDTFDTSVIADSEWSAIVQEVFDLSPAGIIKELDLRRPIYKQTAAYGHFGRSDLDLPWERTNKVQDILSHIDILSDI